MSVCVWILIVHFAIAFILFLSTLGIKIHFSKGERIAILIGGLPLIVLVWLYTMIVVFWFSEK